MKALLWASLVIAVIIIIIQELTWIGRTDLALVIIGLAIAVSLQAGYLLWRK